MFPVSNCSGGKKRNFISAVGKSLNIFLPAENNTSTRSEKLTALWLSPDEWMIFSNISVDETSNNYETEEILNRNISDLKLGAVTDVTDQFVMISIKGDKAVSYTHLTLPTIYSV